MAGKAIETINPMVMEIVTDPVECAEMSRRKELYERNWDWLEAHASEAYSHRGRYICIAGQGLFVGDSIEQALRAAKAAHPEDDGRFTRYIPSKRPSVPSISMSCVPA